MSTQVIMPQLGESVVEGTVSKWLKAEGQSVNEFEPLLEVNTDKVDTEIPSPVSGELLRIVVPQGQTVQAGRGLAGARGSTPVPPSQAPDTPADVGFISPVVAKIAAEYQVDLSQVRGTGTGGRITKGDILSHVRSLPAAGSI